MLIDNETQLVRQVFEDTPKGLPTAISRVTITLEPPSNPTLDDSKFHFTPPAHSK